MSERIGSWGWRDKATWNRQREFVEPAFSSAWQALLFLGIMITSILLPLVIDSTGKITRRHSYEVMPERHGAFTFAEAEIFDNKDDLDLLFVGSSVLFTGVDTPRVQQDLTRELGRDARVVTFGHYFNSFDIIYMQLRDLLERKRARLVILSVPRMPYTDGPSALAHNFIRYSESKDVLAGLPYRYHASLYACTILRSPHDLISLIRPNLSRQSPWAKHLGADKTPAAMGRDIGRFTKFVPPAPTVPAGDLIYSTDTSGLFEFTGEPISTYQQRYLDETIKLLERKNVPVAFINIPQYTERHSTRVVDRENWVRRFPTGVAFLGIRPAVLFRGLSEEEIERLYFDDAHLNANGNELFTEAILPAIRETYLKHATKDQ